MATNDSPAAPKPGKDAGPIRRDDIVLEELDGEAILYDPRYGAIHRFNAATLLVWDMCDGSYTLAEMAHHMTQLGDVELVEAQDNVQRAIAEMRTLDLLQGVPDEPLSKTNVPRWTKAPSEKVVAPVNPTGDRSQPLRLSRRQLLAGGVGRLIIAAPVISTFFATGAYASEPGGSAAFGAGGCKTVGFSCVNNNDCCDGGTDTACQDEGGPTKICCIQHNRPGCSTAEDCCNMGDICNAGTCE